MKVSAFLGINNRLSDEHLTTPEDGNFLRDAVNVDVTDAKRLRLRKGFKLAIPGEYAHSVWSNGGDSFYVDNGTLYRLREEASGMVRDAVRTGLAPSQTVSYTRSNGEVVFTNGQVIGRIVGGATAPLLYPAPNPVPSARDVASGSLPDSVYLYCFAHVDAAGVVGLATQVFSLNASGSIEFSIPTPPVGLRTRVYVTSPGDDTPQHLLDSPGGTALYSIPQWAGAPCPTLHKQALPPGRIVREFNGRLCSVVGNTLYYSDAYHQGVMASTNYIPFPEEITIFEPCDNGAFVVADRTYWLAGADISKAEILPVNNNKASFGSSARLADNSVVWFSSRGLVKGTVDGQVEEIMYGKVEAEMPETAATFRRSFDGIRQFVASGAHRPGFGAVGCFMDAE